jgi:zinc and cadmium transporter
VTVIWILASALAVTVAGVGGAGLILLLSERVRQRLMQVLVAYAAGALLAAALLGLIPEAVEHAPAHSVLATALAAVVACFALEQVLVWRHCHDAPCEGHRAAVPLVLLGDGLHNFVDGVAIAAAFLDSLPLGLTTTLAIVAHEIPQELGDFAVLLDAGQSPRRALVLNFASGLTAVAGALMGYVWLARVHVAGPYVLGISAATFLYIALVDLLADFHRRVGAALAMQRFVALAAGIATIGWVVSP